MAAAAIAELEVKTVYVMFLWKSGQENEIVPILLFRLSTYDLQRKSLLGSLHQKNVFPNFSCMFLNPNDFNCSNLCIVFEKPPGTSCSDLSLLEQIFLVSSNFLHILGQFFLYH